MTTFVFTSPEGKEHEVSGPNGATQEQAFQVLQQHLGQQQPPAASKATGTIVRMPDGQLVQMPDNPTDEQLAMIRELMPAPLTATEPPRTLTEQVARQLGLATRDLITGLGGTASVIGDPLNATINKVAGTRLKPVSQAIQDTLDTIGLPKPETGLEKGVNAAATLVAGAMDPAMLAARGLFASGPLYDAATQGARRVNPVPYETPSAAEMHAEQVLAAKDAGYVMTPQEAGGGPLARGVARLAGTDQLEAMARYENQPVTNAMVRRQAGIGQNQPINEATIDQAVADALPARAKASDLPALRQAVANVNQARIGLTDSGQADASRFARAADSGQPLAGNYATVANAARVAPDSMSLGTAKPDVFSPLERYVLFGGGVGHFLPVPHLSWPAAIPLARAAARYGIMSNAGQALMTNPAVPGMTSGLWQNAVPTAYNLGSGLFGQ